MSASNDFPRLLVSTRDFGCAWSQRSVAEKHAMVAYEAGLRLRGLVTLIYGLTSSGGNVEDRQSRALLLGPAVQDIADALMTADKLLRQDRQRQDDERYRAAEAAKRKERKAGVASAGPKPRKGATA